MSSPKSTSLHRCRFHTQYVHISDEARGICAGCSRPDASALPRPRWAHHPGIFDPVPPDAPVPPPRQRDLNSDWRAGRVENENPANRNGEGPAHRNGEGLSERGGEGPANRNAEGPANRNGEGSANRNGEGSANRNREGPANRNGKAPADRNGEGLADRNGDGGKEFASPRGPALSSEDEVESTPLPRTPAAPTANWITSSLKKFNEIPNWEYRQPEQITQVQATAVPDWIVSSRKKLDEDSNWEYVQPKKSIPEHEPMPDQETTPEEATDFRRDQPESMARADVPSGPATNQRDARTPSESRRNHLVVLKVTLQEWQGIIERNEASARHRAFEKFKHDNPNVRYKDFDMVDAFYDPTEPPLKIAWGNFLPAVFFERPPEQ